MVSLTPNPRVRTRMEKKQTKAAKMLERLENRHAELLAGVDALNLRVNEALERYCITPTGNASDKSAAPPPTDGN